LTKFTPQIAATGGNREGGSARQEMKQRFFFDRVVIDRSKTTINQGFQIATLIFPDSAKAPVSGGYDALART